ncbi:hypothetical protein FQR65_LT13277 [Abscondita terminalis]|nr:hypothetical protein FQR65_LT13277 [Abscondita terminalis]
MFWTYLVLIAIIMSIKADCNNNFTNYNASLKPKCSICGNEVIPGVKVNYRDLMKCMLYELLQIATDFELCQKCNQPLIRCSIGLNYIKMFRRYRNSKKDFGGCFMCGTKLALQPFYISTYENRSPVLRRLRMQYHIVTDQNTNACKNCIELIQDLKKLHNLYSTYIINTAQLVPLTSFKKISLRSVDKMVTSPYQNLTQPINRGFLLNRTCPCCGFEEPYP